MVDIERSVTFSEYNAMDEELGMMDEETVNWPVLCTRIFAFFLLLLIIICFGLEEITSRFLLLAAMICGLLIIVIFATYFDVRKLLCCFKQPPPPPPTLGITGITNHPSIDSRGSMTSNPLTAKGINSYL